MLDQLQALEAKRRQARFGGGEKRIAAQHAEMLDAVETHAWDGEWYIRAFDAKVLADDRFVATILPVGDGLLLAGYRDSNPLAYTDDEWRFIKRNLDYVGPSDDASRLVRSPLPDGQKRFGSTPHAPQMNSENTGVFVCAQADRSGMPSR